MKNIIKSIESIVQHAQEILGTIIMMVILLLPWIGMWGMAVLQGMMR